MILPQKWWLPPWCKSNFSISALLPTFFRGIWQMTRPFHFYNSPGILKLKRKICQLSQEDFLSSLHFGDSFFPLYYSDWVQGTFLLGSLEYNFLTPLSKMNHKAERRPKSRKLLSSCVQFVYNILMTSSTKSRECNIISLVILTVFFTLRAEQQDKIWTQMYRDFFVFDNVNYRFLIWPDDQ